MYIRYSPSVWLRLRRQGEAGACRGEIIAKMKAGDQAYCHKVIRRRSPCVMISGSKGKGGRSVVRLLLRGQKKKRAGAAISFTGVGRPRMNGRAEGVAMGEARRNGQGGAERAGGGGGAPNGPCKAQIRVDGRGRASGISPMEGVVLGARL
jgi:hypothetical protein